MLLPVPGKAPGTRLEKVLAETRELSDRSRIRIGIFPSSYSHLSSIDDELLRGISDLFFQSVLSGRDRECS